ncbi:MAG: class I SAM-dependent methyltransferase [Firmicutes bacterium]|nr:class I SAM-dependent methyltransferase [Bacillota bacterium]
MAQVDPLWAILTDPDKRNRQWAIEQFFETGRQQVQAMWPKILSHLNEWGMPTPKTALDYGCGIGRISQAFAAMGLRVTGHDISPEMVRLADHWNQYPSHCRYEVVTDSALRQLGDPTFDVVYCAEAYTAFEVSPFGGTGKVYYDKACGGERVGGFGMVECMVVDNQG